MSTLLFLITGGVPALNQHGGLSLSAAAVSLGGALILLAVWSLVSRGRIC
jgi:2-keto-3-deoxy-6-phosphogluconate aldolase